MSINITYDDVKIIECPRDAMQGIHDFIPTETKISYINALLKVGFDTLDCGSFVSPKAVPQMKDTAEVLNKLDLDNTDTKLSVIVANQRGVNDALQFDEVTYLGFPFSVSQEFQKRNTNKSIEHAFEQVKQMWDAVQKAEKEMVIYISMGFGNIYNEDWSPGLVTDWVGKIHELGLTSFSISDTVGVSNTESISNVFSQLFRSFEKAEFGAHFHTRPDEWREKVDSAFMNGCKRFDGAILGYGGCPMTNDALVGNMPTEKLIDYFGWGNIPLKKASFMEAFEISSRVFSNVQ